VFLCNRLLFAKPLRGIMKRTIKRNNYENVSVEFYKNFHDEKEWRYVPNPTVLCIFPIMDLKPLMREVFTYLRASKLLKKTKTSIKLCKI